MTLPLRKLERPEESERKRKRNTLLLSVLMISILVFSTAGYFSLREGETSDSGNKNVENIGDSWILRHGDQTMTLSNSPESGENVSILVPASLEKYYGRIVYVASESDFEFYEIASTLGRYTERMQQACYGKCDKNLPEKDCNETVIVIKNLSASTILTQGKVYEEGNCVFIEGGLVAVDAFLYRIFGVN